MSEWNRRDREQDRNREDRDRRGASDENRSSAQWRDNDRGERQSYGSSRYNDDSQSGQGYSSGGYGAERYGDQYGAGQRRSGQDYARGGQYGAGQGYGEGRRYGQSYGSDTYAGYGRSQDAAYGQRYSGTYGQRYGGDRTYASDYRGGSYDAQDRGAVGENERLQRVSDGETDRGHFFGGGMSRQGEHRGRGPKNYTRSDDRIRDDINDWLSDDSWLDASEIDVQVNSAEVTLTGAVNSRDDKRRAEDIAEQVSGVKHVQNNLRVTGSHAASTQSQGTTSGATPASPSMGARTTSGSR